MLYRLLFWSFFAYDMTYLKLCKLAHTSWAYSVWFFPLSTWRYWLTFQMEVPDMGSPDDWTVPFLRWSFYNLTRSNDIRRWHGWIPKEPSPAILGFLQLPHMLAARRDYIRFGQLAEVYNVAICNYLIISEHLGKMFVLGPLTGWLIFAIFKL